MNATTARQKRAESAERQRVKAELRTLRGLTIVALRFEGLTLAEVGKRVGLSKQNCWREERIAVAGCPSIYEQLGGARGEARERMQERGAVCHNGDFCWTMDQRGPASRKLAKEQSLAHRAEREIDRLGQAIADGAAVAWEQLEALYAKIV